MDSTDCFLEILLLISHPTVVAKSLFWSIAIVLALIIINSLAGIVITSANWVTQLPLPMCNWPPFM